MTKRARRVPRPYQAVPFLLLACVSSATLRAPQVWAQTTTERQAEGTQKPALTVAQVVGRLQEKNREREQALRGFQGTRIYQVRYHGFFGTQEAKAVVSCSYFAPDHKGFVVVSQEGAKFILKRIIQPLLDNEEEAMTRENRERTALSTANYDFTLAEEDTARQPSEYVLNVYPKHDYKFLYRGKIWVDATDFAVTRIEAEPAKSPSFWIKRTEVHHRYQKIGNFWLPAKNETESWIRMGGRALLSIEYDEYKGIVAAPIESASATTSSK